MKQQCRSPYHSMPGRAEIVSKITQSEMAISPLSASASAGENEDGITSEMKSSMKVVGTLVLTFS